MVSSVRRVIDGASHGPVSWTKSKSADFTCYLLPRLAVLAGGGVVAMCAQPRCSFIMALVEYLWSKVSEVGSREYKSLTAVK